MLTVLFNQEPFDWSQDTLIQTVQNYGLLLDDTGGTVTFVPPVPLVAVPFVYNVDVDVVASLGTIESSPQMFVYNVDSDVSISVGSITSAPVGVYNVIVTLIEDTGV